MKNILVGQSGGPTAVINGSLYGVIQKGLEHSETVNHIYGMVNGIEGFLNDHIIDLKEDMFQKPDFPKLEVLKNTPGAYLGSCRYKLPEDLSAPVYPELFKKFEEKEIYCVLYIGGNDSMDTVSKLSRYAASIHSPIRIIGIPKTIDNDLIETDHTPGFGSAAKYVATTVREISLDAAIYNTKSVTIVEIMGRHAGWLTASSILARKYGDDNPYAIYLPEVPFDCDAFLKVLREGFTHTSNLVICVSEGIRDKEGKFICEYTGTKVPSVLDSFGHKVLTGCGKFLENYVREHLNVKVRSIELNVSQRCASGNQSGTDLKEAIGAGFHGTQAALDGETGKMVSFFRRSNSPYRMEYILKDVNKICNQEKLFPLEWVTHDGTDISKEFIDYVLPLIQGDPLPALQDGMPVFAYRSHKQP